MWWEVLLKSVAQKCSKKKKKETRRIPEFLCYLAKILIFSLTWRPLWCSSLLQSSRNVLMGRNTTLPRRLWSAGRSLLITCKQPRFTCVVLILFFLIFFLVFLVLVEVLSTSSASSSTTPWMGMHNMFFVRYPDMRSTFGLNNRFA